METFTAFIIIVLFGHFIADFIVQTREQAENKSKNNGALFRHVCSYSVCTTLLVTIAAICLSLPGLNPYLFLVFGLVTFVVHFATDYLTSRFNSKMWQSKRNKLFWIGIGFDQFLHAAQLILTSYYCFFAK